MLTVLATSAGLGAVCSLSVLHTTIAALNRRPHLVDDVAVAVRRKAVLALAAAIAGSVITVAAALLQ